jgi:hypothetical protein
MSERKGLQVMAGLLLVVAGIFACYLASQAVELYQLISSWTVKENYAHDVFNVCKLFLWVLGAHWCYTTFCSAYVLFTQQPGQQPEPVATTIADQVGMPGSFETPVRSAILAAFSSRGVNSSR